MIGKYSKLFALTLISLFASVVVVSAKEMTIAEIGEKVDSIDKGVRTAFVIGTHVFSGNHVLTTKDIMVASRTIDVGDINEGNADALYAKMAINVIERSTPTSNDWKVVTPILGDKLADNAEVDVNFVNLKYDGESVNTDDVIKNAIADLNAAIAKNGTLKNKLNITYSNGVVIVKSIDEVELTSHETLNELLTDAINGGLYRSIVLTEIVNEGEEADTATIEDRNDVANAINSFVNDKTSFTIEFNIIDNAINEGAYNKYSVKFVTEYNTDEKIIKSLLTSEDNETEGYNLTCEKGICTFNVKIATTSASDFQDALVANLKTALEEEGVVESILIGSAKVTEANVQDILSAQLAAAGNTGVDALTLGNLLSKKLVITINLVEGAAVSQNNTEKETYTINFVAKLNTDKDVENSVEEINENADATDNYELVYKDGLITFAIIDSTHSISVGTGTGLLKPLYEMKASGLFEKVVLKYGSNSVDLISGATDALLKFVNLLATGSDATAAENVTLNSLNGKSITIELTYNENVVNEGRSKYTVVFTGSVKTDNVTKELIDSLGAGTLTINPENPDSVLDLSGKADLSVKATAATFASKVREYAQLFENIAITYAGKTYNIKYNGGDDTELSSYGDLDALKTTLNAELSNLKGQTMKIVYKLKSSITNISANTTYTVKFTILRNTKADVNNIIKTLKGNESIVPQEITDSNGKTITDSYVTVDGNILFVVKESTTTLENLGLNLSTQLAKFFESTDWYKSVRFIYGTKSIEITKDKSEIKGIDGLITALGGDTTQIGTVADSNNKLQIEFVLADGVTNVEKQDDKDVYTTDTKLTYTIVLSKKVNAQKIVESLKPTTADFKLKVDPTNKNVIRVLYASSAKKPYDLLSDEGLYNSIKELLSDKRYSSLEIKIGSADPMKFVDNTEFNEENLESILDEVFEAYKSENEDFDEKNAIVADFMKALGNNKITLTIKLNSARASFEENNSDAITYELVFTYYKNVSGTIKSTSNTTVEINDVAQNWTDNNLVVNVTDDNKDQKVEVNFEEAILDDLFSAKKIGSIEIGSVSVTLDEYETAVSQSETEKLLKRLNEAILSKLGIKDVDGPKAKDVLNKSITITVNLAQGCTSENARTTETFTISFVDKTTK